MARWLGARLRLQGLTAPGTLQWWLGLGDLPKEGSGTPCTGCTVACTEPGFMHRMAKGGERQGSADVTRDADVALAL